MSSLGIQSQDLPRYLAIGYHQSSNRLGSKPAHGFKPVPPIRSPKAVARRDNSNNWVEKTPGLINDVGQAFVMGIGQVPLKRCRFDSINRQNRNENRMAAERFLIGPHHAAASFFDRFRHLGRSFRRLDQSAFCWPQTLCAGLGFAWPLSGWCAFHHGRNSILVPIGQFSLANHRDHDCALTFARRRLICKIKSCPTILVLLPAPLKARLFVIGPSALKARSFSARTIIPRSQCT